MAVVTAWLGGTTKWRQCRSLTLRLVGRSIPVTTTGETTSTTQRPLDAVVDGVTPASRDAPDGAPNPVGMHTGLAGTVEAAADVVTTAATLTTTTATGTANGGTAVDRPRTGAPDPKTGIGQGRKTGIGPSRRTGIGRGRKTGTAPAPRTGVAAVGGDGQSRGINAHRHHTAGWCSLVQRAHVAIVCPPAVTEV